MAGMPAAKNDHMIQADELCGKTKLQIAHDGLNVLLPNVSTKSDSASSRGSPELNWCVWEGLLFVSPLLDWSLKTMVVC
jgi:hypothetical protein